MDVTNQSLLPFFHISMLSKNVYSRAKATALETAQLLNQAESSNYLWYQLKINLLNNKLAWTISCYEMQYEQLEDFGLQSHAASWKRNITFFSFKTL